MDVSTSKYMLPYGDQMKLKLDTCWVWLWGWRWFFFSRDMYEITLKVLMTNEEFHEYVEYTSYPKVKSRFIVLFELLGTYI